MNPQLKKYLLSALVLLIVLIVAWWLYKPQQANGQLDEFAQCVAEEATMYGAYSCAHCQNQKKMFSDSFRFVKYVECTEDTKTCLDLGINGYPTWIFGDGSRVEEIGRASCRERV